MKTKQQSTGKQIRQLKGLIADSKELGFYEVLIVDYERQLKELELRQQQERKLNKPLFEVLR